jgi:hypothetical protein
MEELSTNDLIVYSVYGFIIGLFLNTNVMPILTIYLGYSLCKFVINVSDINIINEIQKNKCRYFIYGMMLGVVLSQINFHSIALGIGLRIIIKQSNMDVLQSKFANLNIQINKYIEKILPSKTIN